MEATEQQQRNGVFCAAEQRSYSRDTFRSQLSWKRAAVQRGLGAGSRGLVIIISRYLATTSEDIAGWKRQRDFVKCGNSSNLQLRPVRSQ
jgi:hypothetical protein